MRRGLAEGARALTLLICAMAGCGVVPALQAQPAPISDAHAAMLGDDLAVSVLTFAPGEVYWQRFGHNALRVRDVRSGHSVVYNYGVFDFRQEDFLLNFALGRMRYQLQRDSYQRTLELYRREGRWIVEQTLALTPAQRARLHRFLEWNARPENAEYRYDYFRDNCSTRVRDVVDAALDGVLHDALSKAQTNATYRFDATRLMAPARPLMVAIDFALGPATDRPLSRWERSFVPMELMAALREIRVADGGDGLRPLVASEVRLLDSSRPQPPARPPAHIALFAVFGAAFALLLVLRRRLATVRAVRVGFATAAVGFALVTGLSGTVLALMWALTEHVAAWRNLNLLVASPLALLLLPTWTASARSVWRPSRFARAVAGVLAAQAAVMLVPAALTAGGNGPLAWWALLAPAHGALAWVCLVPQAPRVPADTKGKAQRPA